MDVGVMGWLLKVSVELEHLRWWVERKEPACWRGVIKDRMIIVIPDFGLYNDK